MNSDGGCFGMLTYERGEGWSRACDACHAAASAVYCRADEAYLCAGCDARVHHANRVASRHERVPVCDACERAPAALTCRADAAALCAACDADVHSANPLARRHQRVPILPLPSSSFGAGGGGGLPPGPFAAADEAPAAAEEVDDNGGEDEAASWLCINRNCNQEGLFGEDDQVDEYLDFVGYNNACKEIQALEQQQNYGRNEESECVVPSPCHQMQQRQQSYYGMEMEYEVSNAGMTNTTSLDHSVSFTSMDVSIVPDATMGGVANAHFATSEGGAAVDLFAGSRTLQALLQVPMDREAKVLRYREKRKARKFEKRIRYASRKAYAETRTRIKGRFAKRSVVPPEMDAVFGSSAVASDGSYSTVPSFW